MIPIPSIDASDRVDPFDRVQTPIQGFLKNKRINHALHIAASNHDDSPNDTRQRPDASFYAFNTLGSSCVLFLFDIMITMITKHKGLAAHILLPIGSGIYFIL